MSEFNLINNPSLRHIDPKKLQLIQTLADQAGSKKQDEILPYFLAVHQKANALGITFNDEETELILEVLKPKMSPEDIKKIDMILNFTKMMKKG